MNTAGAKHAADTSARRRGRLLLGGLLLLSLIPAVPFVGSQVAAAAGFDGDPSTTERLLESHPTYAAVDISRMRFAADTDDGRHARHVVLSRDDTFADSVAGSSLTDDGPLLFTAPHGLPAITAVEIDRVLPPGGRVLLLGGPAAISGDVERHLQERGLTTERLSGATRVETAVAVADAVRARHPGDDVLLARAWGPSGNDTAAWADSVAGGALAAQRHTPILVTRSGALDAPVRDWLTRDAPSTTTLLGGEAALSNAVAAAVPAPRRISGAERTATAAAIATQLWGSSTTGARRFLVNNGAADAGWAFGFASAGVSADTDAPVLLVTSEVTDATAELARTCGTPEVDLLVVGDGTIVPPPLRQQLDASDGFACGPRGAIVYPANLEGFPACSTLLEHFRTTALEHVGPYGLGGFGPYPMPPPGNLSSLGLGSSPGTAEFAPVPPAAPTVGNDPSQQRADGSGSSGTNVQEEGVDEPDIVKSNLTHIFSVSGAELRIVDVSDGTPSLSSKMSLDPAGSHELLLSGARLLLVTRSSGFIRSGDIGPVRSSLAPLGQSLTKLTSIDVSDPANPTVLSTVDIDGDYRSARMLGSVARVVVQSEPALAGLTFPTGPGAEAEHDAAVNNRQVIQNSSLDDWLPAYTVAGPDGQRTSQAAVTDCSDVRSPPIFSGLGTLSVVTFDLTGSPEPTSSAGVIASGETVYASADRLFVSTGRWGWTPDALNQGPSTEIHGFDISEPLATAYVGSGSAPGYILNQFSLSEHEGYLRVATTSEPPWTDMGTPEPTDNGVHVFAEQGNELVEVGRVRGLGLGERITAVRFFGDLGAVVTFERIDPLFLLDLSDPTAPRVTGELKVPGFSSYLHRVGPDRLLGVGSSATDEGMVTGAQVSLFDIADRSAPRLVDSIEYREAMSPVEYDHRAFLYWPATGLTVVPLMEHSQAGPRFWGAVGINVAPTGIDEVGRATHYPPGTFEGSGEIVRSLVVEGRLFTVSHAGIEANDLSNLAERAFLALQ